MNSLIPSPGIDLLPPWLLALWAQPNIRIALLLIVGAALLFVVLPGKPSARQPVAKERDSEDINRPDNTPLFRRLWWRIRPPADIMTIGSLKIDRTRKPHCAWLGPTGAGKSSAVAMVRVDGRRPTLIATPDVSDPLREAVLRLGGFIWTACESSVPVNFLIGTPEEVAERLTEVFRSGGVGAWKRAARRATAGVIRAIDDAGASRSLQGIGTGLEIAVRQDRELRTVCAGWVSRFLDLSEQFGSSIGHDGEDIAAMLRSGMTVLLDNDAFDHPSLGGDVVALGLAEGKRCASLVPGGFRLIFEEAGQLGERIDLAEPFHRAGRRRKIAVDDLSQAESDLNEGISSNVATRVYFAQELKALQRIAADRLGLDYRSLDPANMRDFTAYVAHGKIRRLVRFPKPPKARPSSYETCPTPSYANIPRPRRTVITELREPVPSLPTLPPPRLVVQEILAQIDRSGHCHLWTGSKDRDGYGYTTWNGNNRGVHRVVWELAYGFLPTHNDAGERLEIDHLCRVRNCVKLDHLELVTKSENSKRRWRVRGVSAS